MFRIHSNGTIILLIFFAGFAGCRGNSTVSSETQSSGTAPVVLTLTDSPPANVSILSAEVTLTGATLNPGNVPLLVSPATLELTRLQTDIAYLSTTNVKAANYTSLMLTFSDPTLTIENDTGNSLATGSSNPACGAGAICTIQSAATNLSTTITPLDFEVAANTGAGLLVDVNLNNLLSSTLGADFINGVTVSRFTPAESGAPPVEAEDVVGQISSLNATNNTFSLQNALETVSLTADNTTAFFQFPTSSCMTPGFACLHNGQILSVDISFTANGVAIARNVVFEDADSSDAEVEGIITSTGPLQFTIVALDESAAITGMQIGAPATVIYTASTPSDVDFTHADNVQIDTTGYVFSVNVPTDLIVGQQVQVRRNPATSSGASITADRVLLRSSRVIGTFQSGVATLFSLSNLPSLFSAHAIPQFQVKTSVPTICTGTGAISTCSLLAATHGDSVRGPLFANSGSPILIASKVLQH